MVRKWRKIAALSRRRISFHKIITNTSYKDHGGYAKIESCITSSPVVDKGHFVVYTKDVRRFVMPLACLKHNIPQELFKMSSEEFGLSTDRPITLPCDAAFMEFTVTLIRRGAPKGLEKALLSSLDNACGCSTLASSSFHQRVFSSKHFLVCG